MTDGLDQATEEIIKVLAKIDDPKERDVQALAVIAGIQDHALQTFLTVLVAPATPTEEIVKNLLEVTIAATESIAASMPKEGL
jgi:hypothetical protein